MAEKIDLIIRTLQDLDIKYTYDNMRKILGCINELDEIKRKLIASSEEPQIELVKDEPEENE